MYTTDCVRDVMHCMTHCSCAYYGAYLPTVSLKTPLYAQVVQSD